MIISYFKRKLAERRLEKQRLQDEQDLLIWQYCHSNQSIGDVAQMTGGQFEEFLTRLFRLAGYTDIKLTPNNDQGGDFLCVSPDGISTVVQAKRWKSPVGNKAVQEVLGAMRHYGCEEGIVVTNSTFTKAAVELAESAQITLHDNRWLQFHMEQFLPATVPEFDREQFEQLIQELVLITRDAATESRTRRKRFPNRHVTLSEGLRYAGQGRGKELAIHEIKTLVLLHKKVSESEKQVQESEERIRDAQARLSRLEEESKELEELGEMLDSLEWEDDKTNN